jgi:hypothetical protein
MKNLSSRVPIKINATFLIIFFSEKSPAVSAARLPLLPQLQLQQQQLLPYLPHQPLDQQQQLLKHSKIVVKQMLYV